MKKWALGLVLMAASFAPAAAVLGGPQDLEIRVNGTIYRGTWTYVGERVYVNIDAIGRLLDCPHIHNALNWQLVRGGKGNPFQLSVDSGKTKLPTARFGGITMVDLEKACESLKVAYHKDFDTGTIDVGSPWAKEYVIGSFRRRLTQHWGLPTGSTEAISYEEDRASWAKNKWNTDHHEENERIHETHEHYFRNY